MPVHVGLFMFSFEQTVIFKIGNFLGFLPNIAKKTLVIV